MRIYRINELVSFNVSQKLDLDQLQLNARRFCIKRIFFILRDRQRTESLLSVGLLDGLYDYKLCQ